VSHAGAGGNRDAEPEAREDQVSAADPHDRPTSIEAISPVKPFA
jgi:hypothetical protein